MFEADCPLPIFFTDSKKKKTTTTTTTTKHVSSDVYFSLNVAAKNSYFRLQLKKCEIWISSFGISFMTGIASFKSVWTF